MLLNVNTAYITQQWCLIYVAIPISNTINDLMIMMLDRFISIYYYKDLRNFGIWFENDVTRSNIGDKACKWKLHVVRYAYSTLYVTRTLLHTLHVLYVVRYTYSMLCITRTLCCALHVLYVARYMFPTLYVVPYTLNFKICHLTFEGERWMVKGDKISNLYTNHICIY